MDKKSTSILEVALTKCEVSLLSVPHLTARGDIERQINDLRDTLSHYATSTPTIAEAMGTAKRVLDLRAAVQQAVVSSDLAQLHRRDRSRALAFYAARKRAATTTDLAVN